MKYMFKYKTTRKKGIDRKFHENSFKWRKYKNKNSQFQRYVMTIFRQGECNKKYFIFFPKNTKTKQISKDSKGNKNVGKVLF